MKTLLRSVFLVETTDDRDIFSRNYLALLNSGLGFDTPEDNLIWTFVQDFFRSHNHVPHLTTIRAHYERISELEAVDRLEQLASLKALTRGDYVRHLETKAEDRRTRLVLEYAKTMAKICEVGYEVKDAQGRKKIYHGSVDSMRFIMEKSHDIVAPTMGGKLSGGALGDTETFRERYERVEADPEFGRGQNSGIRQLDEAMGGTKKGELWLHAAFTGGMKSSLALHWVYTQAVYYQNDSVYFSLEMPYAQCQNILHVMHSYHEKFRDIRIKLGLQPPSQKTSAGGTIHYDRGLDYEKLRYAQLTPVEKRFLFEFVETDFKNPQNQYGEVHIEVGDPQAMDFSMGDIRSKAEILYSKSPFSMLVVDHLGLVSSRKAKKSTTEELNEVLRDAKKLAMGFNQGMGMAVLGLFQISREGYRSAEKAEGRYNLTHLSYANEAERCVAKGTRVPTHRGFLPIEEVLPKDWVWSTKGWKQVLSRFENGVRETLRVTLSTGAVLQGTANHRVRVLVEGDLVWKNLASLTTQDMVVGGAPSPLPSYAPSLPPLYIGRCEKRTVTTPARLEKDFAYLLGAWDGDGCKKSDGIGFTGNRNEHTVKKTIMDKFQTVFGHPLGLSEPDSRPGSFDLRISSQPLKRWWEQIAGRRAVEVPEAIWRAPEEMVCAYLQGLFDTDGSISEQGTIRLGMKRGSAPLLRSVQNLLWVLGIKSQIAHRTQYLVYKGKKKSYLATALVITGTESRILFRERIGFSEPGKLERLDYIQTHARKQTAEQFPFVNRFLRAFEAVHPRGTAQDPCVGRGWYDSRRTVPSAGQVSRGAVERLLLLAHKRGVATPDLDFWKEVLTWRVAGIRSIEQGGLAEVYDLEVGGDCEYQTGPVLSHNSSDIVSTSWIDDDLRKQGRFFMQCLKSRDQAPFERFPIRVEFHCRRLLTDESGIDMSSEQTNEAIGEEIDLSNL